ncbi:MAG: BrnT family toxin [Acidobacteria bacterium]|nr:BrnT family toxin [Acidobacteriota bacterium]MBI3658365.1 BrnT family toxin [Acidobacteriota bacterium]
MRYEWDENKRQANIIKHGIDFVDAVIVFDGNTLIVEDDRFDYGERRFVALGVLIGRVIAVVYTEYHQTIRIISDRRATKYEEKKYFQEIAH